MIWLADAVPVMHALIALFIVGGRSWRVADIDMTHLLSKEEKG